jgi:hypothetical protein
MQNNNGTDASLQDIYERCDKRGWFPRGVMSREIVHQGVKLASILNYYACLLQTNELPELF